MIWRVYREDTRTDLGAVEAPDEDSAYADAMRMLPAWANVLVVEPAPSWWAGGDHAEALRGRA